MKRHKALIVIGGALAVTLTLAAACTFPEVEFAEAEPGTGADGGGETSDQASPADGGVDSRPSLEASPPIDATSEKPGLGECTNACDCDDDNAAAKDAGCGGGKDCDDQDPRAFPGQSFLRDLVTEDTLGDWNCDGTTERLQPVLGSANPCSGFAGAACDRIKGLVADIPCGTYGEYVTCGTGGFNLCVKVDGGTAQQECR